MSDETTTDEGRCCDDPSPHYHCVECGEEVGMMGHLVPGGRIICDRQERRAYLKDLVARDATP